MIVALDHIGISSTNIPRSIDALADAAYNLRFHQRSVPNPPEKQPVLQRLSATHDISLLTHDLGAGIEFLDHGQPNGPSPMALAVSKSSPFTSRQLGTVLIDERPLARVRLEELACEAIVVAGDDSFVCRGVVVRARDLANSIDFWKLCGCRLIHGDAVSARLEFREQLSRKSWSIYLAADSQAAAQYMDSEGVNSVAFMATSMAKAQGTFAGAGFATTNAYDIAINGRMLSVLFVRGPSGENVEIISPASVRSKV